MRKLFAILLTLCMLFSFVSFAGAEENVTITFAFWDNNQEPGMKAIADAYMAAHPGITVEVQVTPWDQYWTKLEASAQGSGEAMPDVFWMHSNQFFKYVTADKLLPLDFEYDYTPYPAGVTALYNFNNVHYAVPKDYDTIALVYNKEIFDNAGIAYPDDTWTWDTLLETAKKLTDPEKGVVASEKDKKAPAAAGEKTPPETKKAEAPARKKVANIRYQAPPVKNQTLVIEMIDKNGERRLLNRKVNAGENIRITAPYVGEAIVTIYLGGNFVWQDRYK